MSPMIGCHFYWAQTWTLAISRYLLLTFTSAENAQQISFGAVANTVKYVGCDEMISGAVLLYIETQHAMLC